MQDALASLVGAACRKDPSLPADTAEKLAQTALGSPESAQAPEIARLLLADQDGLDPSWANAVATAVVELRGSA